MTRSAPAALLCSVLLVACAETQLPPEVARFAETSGSVSLPDPGSGLCRADDATPAVIETETEKVLISPAVLRDDGSVRAPAEYQTETRQVIVEPRREQSFDALCESEITPQLVANLQRALAVRGFYSGPISGELNWRTRRAVRLFQQDQGIDSAILSLETARFLGLVSYGFEQG